MSEGDLSNSLRVKENEEDEDGFSGDANPFDAEIEEEEEAPDTKFKKLRKQGKSKKEKKSKRDKEKKKKKRRYEDEGGYDDFQEEEEDNDGVGSFFDDEAESGEEESEEGGELYDEHERMMFNDVYANKKRATDGYLDRFRNKNEKQINAQYSKKLYKRNEAEEMYPNEKDPKLYIINVKPRHEEEMVLKILNKARHLAQTSQRVTIVSALAMKKKYPGKIFIEAFSEKDVRDSLDGFNHISMGRKLTQLDTEGYTNLFNDKVEINNDFEARSFVRVKKGLYEGDLAKILKAKTNSVDVLIVPRINIPDIVMKIRERTSQIIDDTQRQKKQQELLKLFINHKTNNFKNRPAKDLLTEEGLEQLRKISGSKNIRVSFNAGHYDGLIILNYRFDEIMKVMGTYLPVQIMPFTTSDGNFIDEIKEDKKNFTIGVNFKKGQEAEIVAGELVGHYGIVTDIQDNIGIIKCKNKDKQINGELMFEPLEHLSKRFKQRQRVKVISGADSGKTGMILKVMPKMVQIWTDNENSITINKKNLEIHHGEVICEQNVHNLKKDDLIKTSKGLVGIVLETRKDSIKLLDTNNTIQIISNMDFDSLIPTRNLTAKNRTGDQINNNSIVIIRQGIHEGKRCKVIHVYKQHIFLFNESFDTTAGISVETADNCSLIAKNDIFKKNNGKFGGPATNDGQEEITVGKTIVLKSGPLKGYQGIVKSINKDKIEVRVPSKSTTVSVQRESVMSKQEGMQAGKTPNRRGGATHIYSASPKF